MHRQIISLSLSLSLIFFLAVVSALPTTIHHHQKTRQSQEDGDIEENVPSHLRPGRSWDSQHGRREVSVSVSAVHQETISMDPASSSEMEMELELDPETEGEIFDLGSCPDARIVFTDSSNDGDASFFESRETAPTFTRVEAVDVDLIADFICRFTPASLISHIPHPMTVLSLLLSPTRVHTYLPFPTRDRD